MKISLLTALLSFWITVASGAGATWSASSSSGDWNTAANWTPNTAPNGPSDTATFDTSSITAVSLSDTLAS